MVGRIGIQLAMLGVCGFSGKSEEVEVFPLSSTEQEIHATIKVRSSNLTWLMSAIYASPRFVERRIFME